MALSGYSGRGAVDFERVCLERSNRFAFITVEEFGQFLGDPVEYRVREKPDDPSKHHASHQTSMQRDDFAPKLMRIDSARSSDIEDCRLAHVIHRKLACHWRR
jgi:hypothetical protein